jgi:hypothetical protein
VSKVLNQYTTNNLSQAARLNRKKPRLLWLVIITIILGLFLVPWLFNSNSRPLNIGNMPIKQAVNATKSSDYEFKGRFAFVDKNMEMQIETLKQKRDYFIEHCVKFNSSKTDCEDTWAIVLKDIGLL